MKKIKLIIFFTFILHNAFGAEERSTSFEKERIHFAHYLSDFQSSKKFLASVTLNYNDNDQFGHYLGGFQFDSESDFVPGVFFSFIVLRNSEYLRSYQGEEVTEPYSVTSSASAAFTLNSPYGNIAVGLSTGFENYNEKTDLLLVPTFKYNIRQGIIDFKSVLQTREDDILRYSYYFFEPGMLISGNYKIAPSYAVNSLKEYSSIVMKQIGFRQEFSWSPDSKPDSSKSAGSIVSSNDMMEYFYVAFEVDNTYNSRELNQDESLSKLDFYTFKAEFNRVIHAGIWYSEYYGSGFSLGLAGQFRDTDGNTTSRIHLIYSHNRITKAPIAERVGNHELELLMRFKF